jgi:hypothetical protein
VGLMTEASEIPPRLGSVAFRGVGSRLPPRHELPPLDAGPARAAAPPPPQDLEPVSVRPPRRTRAGEPKPEDTAPGDIPRTSVGTGQLHARIPPYVAEWIRASGQTQRAVLLGAFAERGDDIPASRDPVIISRQRLGLPTRPVPKRRGPTEAVNFSLTGEEKVLVQRRAAELQLSITDFVTELLIRTYDDDNSSPRR